jgi:hypothetical protein
MSIGLLTLSENASDKVIASQFMYRELPAAAAMSS